LQSKPFKDKRIKQSSADRLADSILWIGLAIALFFWVFSAFLRFLDTAEFTLFHFTGNQYELYDRLVVICLFILFGSHVQINIKKRKHAEETLRQSEEKYRSILESIEEGYYEIDPDGRFSFSNPSLRRVFSLTREELVETKLSDFVSGEQQRQLLALLEQIKNDKTGASTFECEIETPPGSQKIIELSVSTINDAQMNTVGFRGIIRDITEKRMLERNLLQSLKDVKEARTGVILGLAKLAECRDTDTGSHLERIREYTKVIVNELRKHPKYKEYITDEYVEDLYHSSILHDIGKVGVPDAILLKPGKLTTEEFEIIKQHAILGGKAISDIDKQFENQSFLTIAKELTYYHHERWDGKGYPNGLKELQIPLSARVVSFADVYDALTSKRCYKDALDHEEAKLIILEERGKAFDPDIVDAFLKYADDFHRIRQTLHEDILDD
jgi:PAS domain S-box-containing protein